jgi:hypothetical protein
MEDFEDLGPDADDECDECEQEFDVSHRYCGEGEEHIHPDHA